MAKQRPFAECKLCGEMKQLCDSHYLPRYLYKITRAPELKNPNPIMSVNGHLKQISAQFRGFVFCESCEDRFNKKGENWILANVPTNYGEPCPVQDALAPLSPTVVDRRFEQYNVAEAEGFDLEKLFYFGASIFWRGAVHDWKTNAGHQAPPVDLGAHREPMRKFLLGTEPLPDDIVLALNIWPYKPVLPFLHPVETETLSEGTLRYWFYVAGLHFFLFVGPDIPKDARESNLAHGIVSLDLGAADALTDFVKQKVKQQHRGPRIDAMFKEIAAIRVSQK